MCSSTFGEQHIAVLVNCGHGNVIPANGARRTIYAPFILERLKSARAIRYTRVYRESDLLGPVPREVAVGPGCSVASAAEMKELIYLPESYNSLSTCIHTLSPLYSSPDLFLPSFTSRFNRLRYSVLSLFSPFSSCRLRPYQPYLNFSPYPPPLGPLAMRLGGYFPLYTFRALFASLYMRIISERPCPWRTWMRLRNLVFNLFSLPPLLRVYADSFFTWMSICWYMRTYACAIC